MDQKVKELLNGLPDSPPKMWSIEDYILMIKKLDLGEYAETFRAESIDGAVFFDLEFSDFPNMRRLHFRKIELWIKDLKLIQAEREKNPKWRAKTAALAARSKSAKGVNQAPFEEELKESLFESKIVPGLRFPKKVARVAEDGEFENIDFKSAFKILGSVTLQKDKTVKKLPSDIQYKKISQKGVNSLVLVKIGASEKSNQATNSEYTISSRGGFIGTNHSCEIVLDDQSVSRFNTEVACFKGTFLFSDKSSYNGTFLRLDHSFGKIRLVGKMTFEIDNFTVQVKDPGQTPMKIKVTDQIKEEGYEELIDFSSKARFCFFGRDSYKINGSKESGFEVEFLKVKDIAYIQIAPEPSLP